MKTFAEWAAIGRAVSRGQRAAFYRVNADQTEGFAVFSEDQTESTRHEGDEGWDILTADEWKSIKNPTADDRPKVILSEGGGLVTVWCGANKQAIAMLKKAGYSFDLHTHRWRKRGKTLEEVKEGWEFKGFRVEVE